MRGLLFVLVLHLVLLLPHALAERPIEELFRRFIPRTRRLQNVAESADLRARISEHRIRLVRFKQEYRDLAHEKAFLEKTLELKRGQRTMQDGQVKLSQAELEDKAKEIAMYKREAPRTLQRYNELIRVQRQLQGTLNRLHKESEQLVTSRETIMEKIHTLSMGDLVERHARGLPDAMAGALRKSAAALVPFFDYLAIAADTNNRLVDHVGKEIDRYAHVNIAGSPFMSGLLFYCVLLIPILTIVAFARRILDSSVRLTPTHFIIMGNFYFLIVCMLNVVVVLLMGQDPIGFWFERHGRTFIAFNLFLALYYVWHVGILALQSVISLERRNISQLLATISVGVHYFLFTWRRVFTDTPPKMYMFNYMMYATIFAFILYERLGRLSSRQLSESVCFRFVNGFFMRQTGMGSSPPGLENIKQLANSIWAALTMSSTSSRRFSRRRNRTMVPDKHKNRPDKRDRQKNRQMESEEEESDVVEEKRNTVPRGKRKKREKVKGKQQESRGFISIFFGGRESESESSSSDSDDPRYPEEAQRSTRSGVSNHKHRKKESPRSGPQTFWKWS